MNDDKFLQFFSSSLLLGVERGMCKRTNRVNKKKSRSLKKKVFGSIRHANTKNAVPSSVSSQFPRCFR